MRKYENSVFLLERIKVYIYTKTKQNMETKTSKNYNELSTQIARYFAKNYDKCQLYPNPKKSFNFSLKIETLRYTFNSLDSYVQVQSEFTKVFNFYSFSSDRLRELIKSNLESWGYPYCTLAISGPSKYHEFSYINCIFE